MKLFGSFTLLVVVAAALIQESNARISSDSTDVNVQAKIDAAVAANKGGVAAKAHVGTKAQVAQKGKVSHKKLVKHKKKKHVTVVKHSKGFVPRKHLTPAQVAQKNKVKSLLVKVPKMKATAQIKKSIKHHKKKGGATKGKPSKGKPTKGKPTKGKPTKGKPTKGKPTKKPTTKPTPAKPSPAKPTPAKPKPPVVVVPVEDEPVELTEAEQLDYMCYSSLKAERPVMQIVEEIGDALSTVTEDYTYTFDYYKTLTVTAAAGLPTRRAEQQKRQFDEQAMAILMNPDSTPEQVKAVTDAISKSYGQDIISQACFELVYNGEYDVTYTTTTPEVETEYRTIATTTNYAATVTVDANGALVARATPTGQA